MYRTNFKFVRYEEKKPYRTNSRRNRPRSARQLRDRALPRRLVLAPPEQLRPVADALAADLLERDLDDQLGSQRDPLQLLVALPAARVGAAALARLVRRQPLAQRALLGRAYARRVADDLELA